MYDTVAALWRHPPADLVASIPWTRAREWESPEGRKRTRQAGYQGSVQVIEHPDGTLKAERSLPKALTGQNAVDLTQSDVGEALGAIDRELWELSGYPRLVSVAEWDPCRVDYCVSQDLGDDALVDVALRRLAGVTMPRKGRPVVGESGSVAWPSGMFRPKVYNKGREDGQDAHRSLLRLEVGAIGSRALASIPGLLTGSEDAPEPGDEGPRLQLVDALVPTAHDYVLGRFSRLLGGSLVNADDYSDVEFMRRMVGFFGGRRTASIIGYCLLWSALGIRTGADLDRQEWGEATTWYRVRADIVRFRDDLAKEGDPGTLDDVRERIVRLAA